MLLNVFNVERFIRNEVGGFDDSIYVISTTLNKVELSINSVFDWESLADKLVDEFPEADFVFNVIALVLIIKWWFKIVSKGDGKCEF